MTPDLQDLPIFRPQAAGVERVADEIYERTRSLVIKEQIASVAFIQRHLRLGYRRACGLMDRLQLAGVVGPLDDSGHRDILIFPIPDASILRSRPESMLD
ncbi:DNA translocase FtsK [Achromobacter denitrificans]